MSRAQVWVRVSALVVVALLGVYYITFDVIGWRIGAQSFQVTVDLPRGGGLYSDGFVTYRGVDVGRIASLTLSPSGAVATLAIDPGTSIPANAIAHVHELSVAGEQYLDLVPTSPQGPVLHAGSLIPLGHTVVPVSVFQLLSDAGQLIGSIKSSEVQTITDALGTGFADTGQALRNITVASRHLISALQAALAATVTLINAGGAVLSTAQASSADILSFSQSLATITAQLSASNADIVAVLDNGVPTEQAVQKFIGSDGAALIQLIKELDGLSDVAIAQQPAVVSLLQQLPGFVNKIADTASGGSVAVNIYYNTKNSVCPYLSGAQTPEPTAATGAPDLMRTCTLQAPDLLQRGSAEAPLSSGG
ncbi:MAG TPA: MlaD family protein [Acidimicrobiales bacterium]|nr:MlaD family protein [Acidimicrobiales bacterium]